MNLQDVLSYRDACIHCQRPLQMRITSYPKLSITQSDEGLKIRSGHQDGVYLFYKPDGTFERNKRNYKIHQGPVTIQKFCPFHSIKTGAVMRITGNSKSASTPVSQGTSIDTMKNLNCQYTFTFVNRRDGNYLVNLLTEFLYHFDDQEFLHVNTWFISGITNIYSAKFSQTIDEMLKLKLPAANLKNVKNVDQLINKVKLYTLFS